MLFSLALRASAHRGVRSAPRAGCAVAAMLTHYFRLFARALIAAFAPLLAPAAPSLRCSLTIFGSSRERSSRRSLRSSRRLRRRCDAHSLLNLLDRDQVRHGLDHAPN